MAKCAGIRTPLAAGSRPTGIAPQAVVIAGVEVALASAFAAAPLPHFRPGTMARQLPSAAAIAIATPSTTWDPSTDRQQRA